MYTIAVLEENAYHLVKRCWQTGEANNKIKSKNAAHLKHCFLIKARQKPHFGTAKTFEYAY